jgi:hypothetical protein
VKVASIASVCLVALFFGTSVAGYSAEDEAVPGHAVLAQPGGDALVIWNASQVVASIVRSKMSPTEADSLLEHDAIRVLAKMLPDIDATAKTITVRVIYALSGEVSPLYGNPTFKGFEQYALLSVNGRDARAHKLQLSRPEEDPISGTFSYKIIGRLPPRI